MSPKNAEEYKKRLLRKIERQENRGQANKPDSFLWLRVFGMIGWSVVVPPLLGILLGMWIDGWTHSRYSFTLTLMLGGLAFGCFNAWTWLKQFVNKP